MASVIIEGKEINRIIVVTDKYCQYVGFLYKRNLENLGFNVEYKFIGEVSGWEDDALYFLAPALHLDGCPKYYVVVQLEQLKDDNFYTKSYIKVLKGALAILEYSDQNISILEERFDEIYYMPVDVVDRPYDLSIASKDKDIDLLYYGTQTTRRKIILAILDKENIRYKKSRGLYGKELVDTLARSKAILNIHKFSDRGILETTRISEALSTKSCLVFSEYSDDLDKYPYLSDYVDFFQGFSGLRSLIEKYSDPEVYEARLNFIRSRKDSGMFKNNLINFFKNSSKIEIKENMNEE